MANKLGNKHLCEQCGIKYYDFGKSKIICPKCGTEAVGTEESDGGKSRKRTKGSKT